MQKADWKKGVTWTPHLDDPRSRRLNALIESDQKPSWSEGYNGIGDFSLVIKEEDVDGETKVSVSKIPCQDYEKEKLDYTLVNDIGLRLAHMVVCDESNKVIFKRDSTELDNGDVVSEDLARHCDYSDRVLLSNDCVFVASSDQYCGEDVVDEYGIVYSDYEDKYLDPEDDYVRWGICKWNSNSMGWFWNEEYVYCDQNDTYYRNSEVASDHNVYYSDRHGEWRVGSDQENADYHELERQFRMNDSTTFAIGFEIEKEDECVMEEYKYREVFDDTGWCKEDDGSLQEGGFELVSPAFDLMTNDLDEQIKSNLCLKRMINADHSTRCGGHVNISSTLYSAHEMLEGLSSFFPLLYALYDGRLEEGGYSPPKEKWKYHNDSGYAAVKLRGNRSHGANVYGLVELRIFSAVRNVSNLKWRRDLVRLFIENFGKSEKDVLRLLVNPKSKLFRHLLKVYDVDRIVRKIGQFVSFTKQYNHKVLSMPDLNELTAKLKKQVSTDELGA